MLPILLFLACDPEEIIPPVESIGLQTEQLSMEEGDSINFEVLFNPINSWDTVVWESTNEKVAIIDSLGKLNALSRGTATIIATVGDLKAYCSLTVTREDLPYSLIWSEEFNESSLDLTKWNIETGGLGWGNQELQNYTGRPENLRLENGFLIIEALKEQYEANNYTSARINTKDKFDFTYGKVEARISLPSGQGTWPAFWMMGSNISYVRWPLCGEVDIMEHAGRWPSDIIHAVHTYDKNGAKGNNWYSRKVISEAENTFHTFGVEWEERYNEGDDCINFYIDGVKTATIWEPHVDSTVKNWPFNQDFFFLFNLAIGGTMGGTVDDAIFNAPVKLQVDYLRVYQRQ